MSLLSAELNRLYAEIARVTVATGTTDPSTSPVFTWNNTEYKALAILQTDGNLFGAGGLTADNNLTITVDLSVFSSDIPQAEDMLTYSEREYRIKTIEKSPTVSSMIMKCIDPNRGTGIVEREY